MKIKGNPRVYLQFLRASSLPHKWVSATARQMGKLFGIIDSAEGLPMGVDMYTNEIVIDVPEAIMKQCISWTTTGWANTSCLSCFTLVICWTLEKYFARSVSLWYKLHPFPGCTGLPQGSIKVAIMARVKSLYVPKYLCKHESLYNFELSPSFVVTEMTCCLKFMFMEDRAYTVIPYVALWCRDTLL